LDAKKRNMEKAKGGKRGRETHEKATEGERSKGGVKEKTSRFDSSASSCSQTSKDNIYCEGKEG